MSEGRPHVVIIGCGFGGLEAVRALSKAAVEITLVDRTNHHLFQPHLYQVATAGLSAPAVSAPIRHTLRREMKRGNLTILQAEVIGFDVAKQSVLLDGDQTLAYDHLIVAAGATHSYFGHDGWAVHAPGLKTLADAFAIRARVIGAFERASLVQRGMSLGLGARFQRRMSLGGPRRRGSRLAGSGHSQALRAVRAIFGRCDGAGEGNRTPV